MASTATGAMVRAVLAACVVAAPALVLRDGPTDTAQIIAFVALFAGLLTFVEYYSAYPSLVEFRDAPPFNRVRYLMLLATLLLLSVIMLPPDAAGPMAANVQALGHVIGSGLDFPYSPVRLVGLLVEEGASEEQVRCVVSAAGIAYLVSLVALTIFVILIRAGAWPRRLDSFNVWINLPTFDPTHGGDVVMRLQRDARANIAIGFLLPFITPAVIKIASGGFNPLDLNSPLTLVWTITIWSFLPASLFMRGIAMLQVAELIRETRAALRMEQSRERLATA